MLTFLSAGNHCACPLYDQIDLVSHRNRVHGASSKASTGLLPATIFEPIAAQKFNFCITISLNPNASDTEHTSVTRMSPLRCSSSMCSNIQKLNLFCTTATSTNNLLLRSRPRSLKLKSWLDKFSHAPSLASCQFAVFFPVFFVTPSTCPLQAKSKCITLKRRH